MRLIILFFFSISIHSQNIDVNNNFSYDLIRTSVLNGNNKTDYSFNIKPINSNEFSTLIKQHKTILTNKKNKWVAQEPHIRILSHLQNN